MTPDEINRAIAEHVGARFFTEDGGVFWHFVTSDGRQFWPPTDDLNAMHEAEKTLTESQREVFADHIIRMSPFDKTNGFDWINANSTQRAEAFLRTIGKWRDE